MGLQVLVANHASRNYDQRVGPLGRMSDSDSVHSQHRPKHRQLHVTSAAQPRRPAPLALVPAVHVVAAIALVTLALLAIALVMIGTHHRESFSNDRESLRKPRESLRNP